MSFDIFSTGLELDYWTLMAAANACYFTYMAAWPTLFSKQWRHERIQWLRKRFGQSPKEDLLNEIAAEKFRRAATPVYLVLAVICWLWLAHRLSTAH